MTWSVATADSTLWHFPLGAWVDPPATLDTWTDLGGGAYSIDNTTGGEELLQTTATDPDQNSRWLCRFEVYDYVSGSVKMRIEDTGGTSRSADGEYSEILTAFRGPGGDEGFAIRAAAGFEGKVRNISFELIEDWTVQ